MQASHLNEHSFFNVTSIKVQENHGIVYIKPQITHGNHDNRRYLNNHKNILQKLHFIMVQCCQFKTNGGMKLYEN